MYHYFKRYFSYKYFKYRLIIPSEPYSTVSNPGPSHGIGGSGGDDDRNPYNRRPPYDSYSPRDKRKKKSKAKESKTEEEEENNPDVKIIWLYPLDKDGNLIFPEDEFVTSINNTVFEDRSNTFLNPEARRVYYSNPGTSSGDWGNTQDNWNTWGTWGSEWNPYGELATVNRYDRNELTLLSNRSSYGHDLLNSPENASTPRTGRVNSPPPPSISRFARPIRGRNIYGSAQITTASMNLVTSETTFSSAPISGSNTTGRYVIPQRRVHFESTHTTSAPINIPGVRNTEGMPAHLSPVGSPPRGESSYYADTYHRGSSRQAHQTLFYGDTDSSSNTSTETEMPPTYFNIPEGQSSNRGLATDAYFNPDMYTNYQEQEVWEPLPFTRPLESFDTSFSSTPVGSRLNESTDSSNVDAYWDIPAHQETSTSANRPSLPSDSNIQISRRQNQHDVDPRVDNDRLVIPLFRLDREGNLIYEDFNSSDEEEEDEVKSLSPTVKLFAPMEYKFDLEDSSDPSSTSSARSEEEKKDYTSKGCYSAFGIAYTTKNKSAGKTTVTRTTAGTTHYTTSHPLVASPGSTDITRSVDILLAPRASSISPETRNRIYNAQIASADRTSQALARDIDSYFHGSHRVADRNSSSPPNQNIFTIPEETMTVQQNARIEEIAQIIRNYNLSSPQTPMYSRSFEIDNVRIYTYTESPRNDNNDDDDDDDDTSSPEELAESLPDILDEVSFESLEIPCVENVEETPEELSLESTDNSSSDNMEEQSSKDTIHTNTPRNYKFRTHSQNVDIRQIQETEVSQEAENSVAGPSGLQSSDNQINQQANETIHYVNGIRLSNFAVPQGSTGIPGIIVNAPSFQEVMQESTDDNYTINGDNYPPQNVNLANDEDVDEVEIHGSWEDIDY